MRITPDKKNWSLEAEVDRDLAVLSTYAKMLDSLGVSYETKVKRVGDAWRPYWLRHGPVVQEVKFQSDSELNHNVVRDAYELLNSYVESNKLYGKGNYPKE